MSASNLVRHAPDDIGGALLAADGALSGCAGLAEGHTPAGDANLLLHGHLAGQIAAPLGVDEAAAVFLDEVLDLLPGFGGERVLDRKSVV